MAKMGSTLNNKSNCKIEESCLGTGMNSALLYEEALVANTGTRTWNLAAVPSVTMFICVGCNKDKDHWLLCCPCSPVYPTALEHSLETMELWKNGKQYGRVGTGEVNMRQPNNSTQLWEDYKDSLDIERENKNEEVLDLFCRDFSVYLHVSASISSYLAYQRLDFCYKPLNQNIRLVSCRPMGWRQA